MTPLQGFFFFYIHGPRGGAPGWYVSAFQADEVRARRTLKIYHIFNDAFRLALYRGNKSRGQK